MDSSANVVRVTAPITYKDQLKAVPGARWDRKHQNWVIPATPTAISTLERIVPVTNDGTELTTFADLILRESTSFQALDRGEARSLPQPEGVQTPLWGHQLAAFHMGRALLGASNLGASAGLMLAMWMGTGKTLVSIALDMAFESEWTLVLCPKAVIPVWPADYAKHAPDANKRLIWADPNSSKSIAKRVEMMREEVRAAKRLGQGVVVIVNYESAWREPMNTFLTKEISHWDTVVADESSKIKAPGSKVSQWCAKIRDRARRRIALNGTPFPHSPLDIYAQYRFLDPGVFGLSYAQFKAKYAIMGGFGQQQVVAYQNLEELGDWYRLIAFQAGADVLDLPEELDVTWEAQLSGPAAKAYAELENEFYTQVDSGEVTVSNALTKLLRLQQITGGTLPLEEGPDERIDEAKAELLAELFADLEPEEPVVVFARFRADLDRIAEVAGKAERGYRELSGHRNELTEWQGGAATVLGVQISSGSLGIDLTRARYGVYYSLGFSLGEYLQSRARLHRPGQERTTMFYHLIATGTVDEKIQKALAARQDVVETIVYGGEA